MYGGREMKKRGFRKMLLIIAGVLLIGLVGVQAEEDYFNNMESEYKLSLIGERDILFEKEAKMLYDMGLFKGKSTEQYLPDLQGKTNRQEAIKQLGIILQWDIEEDQVSQFTDVEAWAQPYVKKAVELGITNGKTSDSFGGEDPITGRELLTFLLRAIGYDSEYVYDMAEFDGAIEFGINSSYGFHEQELNRDLMIGGMFIAFSKGIQRGNDYTLIEEFVYNNRAYEEMLIKEEIISPNYRKELNMYHDSGEERVSMEYLEPYFVEDKDTYTVVKQELEKIGVVPLSIRVSESEEYIPNDSIYSYPDEVEDLKVIVLKCRFGSIELQKGEKDFYISSIYITKKGYFDLYGFDINKAIDLDGYMTDYELTVKDSYFAYDSHYKHFANKKDIKSVIRYKQQKNEQGDWENRIFTYYITSPNVKSYW